MTTVTMYGIRDRITGKYFRAVYDRRIDWTSQLKELSADRKHIERRIRLLRANWKRWGLPHRPDCELIKVEVQY